MNAIINFLKSFWNIKRVTIDNFVFRLHYQWTVLFLVTFSIILTTREYFGDPIECNKPEGEKQWTLKMVNNYCWTVGTFSVVDAWQKKVGEEVPYPGIAKKVIGQALVYHSYYQWVSLVLLIQSGFFYLPRLIWRTLEGGRMCQLVMNLNDVTLGSEERRMRINTVVRYLERNRGKHVLYFWKFALAEGCNFVNDIVQMLFLDAFLGRKFLSFGHAVLTFDGWFWMYSNGSLYTPLVERFPLLAKCNFFVFGSSGDVTKLDIMCHLGLNTLNEKIFVFLWFWLCFLIGTSSLMVAYRILTLMLPPVRLLALRTSALFSVPSSLRKYVYSSNVGDWFLIHTLAQNMDSLHFRDLINDFVKITSDRNGNIDN